MPGQGSNERILVVEKLRKEFKNVVALKGIDMVVDGPGVYGFLGPNGAGKSTTFKIICSLVRPTSGTVLINGVDVRRNPRQAMSVVGVQFDSSPFYPHLTGRENLRAFSLWLDEPVSISRVDRLLSEVGLKDAADRRVSGYSWGMKQRLGLAVALLCEPKLVILDEPTNGLDPQGIVDIRKLLPRLAHEEGRTIILSSHRMTEVEQVCDHVTIIDQGAIVAQGRPADLAAEGNLIEIHCQDPARAAGILEGLHDIVNIEIVGADRVEVFAPNVKASRINQLLIEQGVDVEQMVKRRETLEEVFFRLTRSAESREEATSHDE